MTELCISMFILGGHPNRTMSMVCFIGGESQQRVSPCTTTSRMTAEGELEEWRSEARLRESSRSTLTTLFPKIMRDLTTTLIMSLLELTHRCIRITWPREWTWVQHQSWCWGWCLINDVPIYVLSHSSPGCIEASPDGRWTSSPILPFHIHLDQMIVILLQHIT